MFGSKFDCAHLERMGERDLAAGRADGHNTGNNLSGKWWRGAGAGALDSISLLLQVGTFIFGRWQIGRIERFMS